SWLDATIRLWDVATGQELNPCEGHRDEVGAVAFLSDQRRLATAGLRGSIGLWDPGTGRPLGAWGTPQRDRAATVVFSPDGRLLPWGSEQGVVRASDRATGQELQRWQGHRGGGKAGFKAWPLRRTGRPWPRGVSTRPSLCGSHSLAARSPGSPIIPT